jgi:hypothetical protein
VSGKSNLTYEEALVSEQRAAEKAQQLPRELISPVLQMVRYSRSQSFPDYYIIDTILMIIKFQACDIS